MLERQIVQSIQKLAPCQANFEQDHCIELQFVDKLHPYYGTMRHSKDKKTIFELINKLTSLRTLNFRKCRLEIAPDLDLPNLNHLDLSSNYLGKVPEWIRTLALDYLNLGVNNLMQIPDWFSEQEFKVLKLHKNQITHFPTLKPTLQFLNLYLNKKPTIPDFVWDLNHLEFFSWGMSNITHIPEEIGSLKNLLWLSFVPNALVEIPKTFALLKKLRGVRFAKNQIQRLPENFGELESLEELTLYDNQIQELPESFYQLSLKKFNIAKNPLSTNTLCRLQTTFSHNDSTSLEYNFASC